MKRSYLIAAFIAIAATGWIISGQFNGNSEPATLTAAKAQAREQILPKVRVRAIQAMERKNHLTLFGRTEAVRMVELKAETIGRVISRDVKKGSRVKKGDVIVRLAMNDRQARLDEAKALLEQRRVAYEADLNLSKKEFRSKVLLAASKAALESAKAALRSSQLDIERTLIRASFDGIVEDLPLEVGDYAAVETTVARIVDLDTIVIVGEVSERNIAKIKIDASAEVSFSSGMRTEGIVRYISKIGSQATRTFRIEVAVENPGNTISEGMTTEMHLDTGSVKAHHLSPAALTLSDEGVIGVKTVNAANKVEFFPVKIIDDTPEGIWLSGLPEATTLITVGQEFVLPGQLVEPVYESESTKS
ncbi:MAG: efflux RND transporter periplasmic adaptor subunit [Rhodospirillales bacterium]|nr:efflux RND transporter periplasmic adaptor subunit [Rhodospirillales bacterium]